MSGACESSILRLCQLICTTPFPPWPPWPLLLLLTTTNPLPPPPSNPCPTQPLKGEAEITAEIDARSLYARPFPMDSDIDNLTNFFSTHAPVNCVRMRRVLGNKHFKGSVFVEFASQADADKVLAMKLEYQGAELHLEKKLDYLARKKAERKARPNAVSAGQGRDVVRRARLVGMGMVGCMWCNISWGYLDWDFGRCNTESCGKGALSAT